MRRQRIRPTQSELELLREQIGDVPLLKAMLLFSDEVDIAIVVPHGSEWNQDHPWLRQLECSDWACWRHWDEVVEKHGVAAMLWKMRQHSFDNPNLTLNQMHQACLSVPEYKAFHQQMVEGTNPYRSII